MDRFNVWVGSLIARSHDLKKDEGQTFVEYALVLVRRSSVAVVPSRAFDAVWPAAIQSAINGVVTEFSTAVRPDSKRRVRRRSGPPLRRRPLTELSLEMKTLTHKIWSRLQREDGQAFVEFVIVLPLLVMLVLGICQFGLAFHNYLSITDATRVGARAAAVKRTAGACAAATHGDPEHGLRQAVEQISHAGSPAPRRTGRTRATRSR